MRKEELRNQLSTIWLDILSEHKRKSLIDQNSLKIYKGLIIPSKPEFKINLLALYADNLNKFPTPKQIHNIIIINYWKTKHMNIIRLLTVWFYASYHTSHSDRLKLYGRFWGVSVLRLWGNNFFLFIMVWQFHHRVILEINPMCIIVNNNTIKELF